MHSHAQELVDGIPPHARDGFLASSLPFAGSGSNFALDYCAGEAIVR
jgi:hypothetical protein